MAMKKEAMHPLPISRPFRIDDDINAAVSNFLSSDDSMPDSKTWQDTTAEITKWLASQIQQEREGWMQKSRAALQEIENHRKEVLRYQRMIHKCTDHMRLIAECCNFPQNTLMHIEQQEPREALHLYIECLTEELNSLIEDRLMCLQILHAEDKTSQDSLPNLLKAYTEELKHLAERAHKEAQHRFDSLEGVNKKSFSDMQRMRRAILRKEEEAKMLHNKLEELKEVTLKKFKEVNEIHSKDMEYKDLDEILSRNNLPVVEKLPSSSSPIYGNPSSLPVIDHKYVQISAERILKLRNSAKNLERSLNVALTQMETLHKGAKSTKPSPSQMFVISEKPNGFKNLPDFPALKKDMKLLPSPMNLWSKKFEIHGPKVHDAELSKVIEHEHEKEARKQKSKDKRMDALTKSQERLSSETPPTFRSLMKSLDEVKKNQGKSFRSNGLLTKCLRCNKLFSLNDNHKKACYYHPKGKERIEQYSDKGKLVKVAYMWKCCMMGLDNPGCTYGQHV